MGYSKTDLFFSLLVRSRGAPPVHVYPPRRTLSAAPWTYMSGGRFLTSSQFFRVVRPVSLSNLQHFIILILPGMIFFSIFLWSCYFCGNHKNSTPDLDLPKCHPCWRYVWHLLFFFCLHTHTGSPVSRKKASLYIHQ